MAKIWTEEHEQFIRDHFRHKTYAELAEHFGVTQKAMESKIRRMGLKKQDYRDPDPMPMMLPDDEGSENSAPVETGPTPIRSAATLPRRIERPRETPEERKARLVEERAAAEVEKERRETLRAEDRTAKAMKHFEAGLKKYHDGRLGKALDELSRVVELSPPDTTMGARARLYAAAIERRGRGSNFVPQDADEHYLLGVVRLNDGDPNSALEAFAEALGMAPGDDRILYCQAAAYAQQGDIDAAIETLREAIDINDANRIYALNDPDFISLRVHEDFRSVTKPRA